MRRLLLIVQSLGVVALFGCAEQRPVPQAPVIQAPPYAVDQGGAEELYKSERNGEAAWVFEQIRRGAVPGDVPRAEFWLAKSFYRLGDYEQALSHFRRMAGQPEHPYWSLSLPWLASLAREPQQRVRATEAMDWYPLDQLEDYAYDEVRDELYFRIGQYQVHRGRRDQGIRLLAQVPEVSDFYLAALLERARVEEARGRRGEARRLYEEILARNVQRAEEEGRKHPRWDPAVDAAARSLRSTGIDMSELPDPPRCSKRTRSKHPRRCELDPDGVLWGARPRSSGR